MYNLPANIEEMSPAELRRLSGQEQEFNGSSLPSLRVNYDDEDDNKNTIPRGQWAVNTEDGTIYSKEALVRIILSTHQYSHFDREAKKMVSQSVHFKSFFDEIPDSAGGFKCGKVSKKDFEVLSVDEKELQKQIKAAKILFCTLSMDGVNGKGEAVAIKDLPCVFYAKGTNFMPMADYLEYLTKNKFNMQGVLTSLTLKREKNDGVTYWQVVPKVVEQIKVDNDVYALLRQFAETVAAENEVILEKFKSARAKMGNPDMREVAKTLTIKAKSVTYADLNDEIPDLGGQSGDLAKDFAA